MGLLLMQLGGFVKKMMWHGMTALVVEGIAVGAVLQCLSVVALGLLSGKDMSIMALHHTSSTTMFLFALLYTLIAAYGQLHSRFEALFGDMIRANELKGLYTEDARRLLGTRYIHGQIPTK